MKCRGAIWATVAQKVTAVGGVEVRTAQNVREKWGALKSESQRRRDNQRATGGGAVKSGEYDSIIYDILGEDTTLTTGVDVEDTDLIVRTASAVNPDISPPLTPLNVVISVDVSEPKGKNRQGLKKTASQSLEAEYFRSHIHRNNFAVEKYKSDIELNNIRIEVLKKQLQ
ncbi:hypothetical protein C0Q70_18404 [Pomacea canaliculata]|uniref:Myb/SANT-like DNA-binding domain-containing protein n=1 Tax=Pomacea canaliculata TaxID=400727 RepID=A0A2T7NN56_POMCA|nr:hypothetical protein C0Q70_18404 [Pomacea canaliculata]